jgi:hypothetical protein
MARKKAHEIYGSFEDWVTAHKHSSASVECALHDALEGEPDSPIEAMRIYMAGLGDLGSEIRGEISEARYWIRYFRKERR